MIFIFERLIIAYKTGFFVKSADKDILKKIEQTYRIDCYKG